VIGAKGVVDPARVVPPATLLSADCVNIDVDVDIGAL
jgi:hypothetical protein